VKRRAKKHRPRAGATEQSLSRPALAGKRPAFTG
jgi:hypothetical protein